MCICASILCSLYSYVCAACCFCLLSLLSSVISLCCQLCCRLSSVSAFLTSFFFFVSWFMVHGLRSMVHGPEIPEPEVWYYVYTQYTRRRSSHFLKIYQMVTLSTIAAHLRYGDRCLQDVHSKKESTNDIEQVMKAVSSGEGLDGIQ